MELKPGYKLTEVGVIPEGWEVQALGSATRIERGKFTARPRDDPKYYGGDVPFIQTGDVRSVSGRITGYSQTLNADGLKVSRLFPAGSLFLTIAANIGDVGVACFATACPDSLVAIEPAAHVDKAWLRHELVSLKGSLEAIATHNAQANLSLEKLRPYQLPVPPLPEQRAIAAALSDVDALLDGLDRLIAKKRDIKQAAMQQLLSGRIRLPGCSEPWRSTHLGECLLSRPDYGINAAAVPFSDRLPRYIRITDISPHGRYCAAPPVSVQATGAEKYCLREGDIVFARTGASVGKSYLYDANDGPLVFAGFLIRASPNPQVLAPAFLAAYARTSRYWDWVRLMSMRSGQPGINGEEYALLPILLPPLSEQTAIAEVLSDMDAEIAALEARRAKTRDLKQAMMQELLTGRTRLVEPSVAGV